MFQSINKNVNQGLEKVLDEIATLKKHLNEKDQDAVSYTHLDVYKRQV